MNVRIEAVERTCFPSDCFVSVRLGETLKQGRYEPTRIYNFQRVERRRNAKVDLYQHVGSCVVPIDPEMTKMMHEVNVASTEPAYAGARIRISVDNKLADPPKPPRAERTSAMKQQAKEYLANHGIEEWLSAMVKAMLKVQPEDPGEFIMQRLRAAPLVRKTPSVDALPAVGRVGTAQLVPFTNYYSRHFRNVHLNDALARFPVMNRTVVQQASQPEKINEIRRQAADKMMKSCLDGKLAAALQSVRMTSEDINKMRQQAACAFAKTAESGELAKTLQAAKKDASEIEDILTKVSQEQQRLEMKASTAATLIDAASNGELESAIRTMRDTEPTPKATQEAPCLEEVWSQAREMLASTNGQLERALQQRLTHNSESVTTSQGHLMPNFSLIGPLFHSTGMIPGMMVI